MKLNFLLEILKQYSSFEEVEVGRGKLFSQIELFSSTIFSENSFRTKSNDIFIERSLIKRSDTLLTEDTVVILF